MVEKLTKLYNTLMVLEVKGENVKILADCLRYTEALIVETQSKPVGQEADD